MFDRRILKNFDYILFLTAILISVLGIITISKTPQGENLYLKQTISLILGIGVILLVLAFNYRTIKLYSSLIYIVSLGFLILLFVFGDHIHGARRWFSFGRFSFQPSEFAKIAAIIMLAKYLSAEGRKFEHFLSLLIPLGFMAIPALLIIGEPDLGSAIVFIPPFFGMLYLARVKPRHLLFLFLGGIGISPLAWHFLREYQKMRLLSFLNPRQDPWGAGYSLIQSKIAIGSGGLLGNSQVPQSRLNFLPEQATDFAFSVWSERWGFIGGFLILSLYLVILYRGLKIARDSEDMFGSLLALGLLTLLISQVVINVGMTLGVMPVTGLPLPFLSYGGSSLIATFLSIGILLNIGMRRFMF
jgi:rod shape determining protein RodA